MTYTIRHWRKLKAEEKWTFNEIHVKDLLLARKYYEAAIGILPDDASDQEFEILREGSEAWRDLEAILNGNPPLQAPVTEDYVGSRDNMEPVVVTRTPDDWEPRAEEGYRFDLMVLQGSTGEYWRLGSFWQSGQAVAAWEALERACKLELEVKE